MGYHRIGPNGNIVYTEAGYQRITVNGYLISEASTGVDLRSGSPVITGSTEIVVVGTKVTSNSINASLTSGIVVTSLATKNTSYSVSAITGISSNGSKVGIFDPVLTGITDLFIDGEALGGTVSADVIVSLSSSIIIIGEKLSASNSLATIVSEIQVNSNKIASGNIELTAETILIIDGEAVSEIINSSPIITGLLGITVDGLKEARGPPESIGITEVNVNGFKIGEFDFILGGVTGIIIDTDLKCIETWSGISKFTREWSGISKLR